jgi:hypothetical protein
MSTSKASQTFVTFGDFAGLGDEIFARAAEARGFSRLGRIARRATLVLASADIKAYKFDKRSFGVQCDIKNLLDVSTHEILTNKRTLHATVAARFRPFYMRYFARTWDLANFRWTSAFTDQHRAFIIRPTTVGYFSGKGITRATSAEDIEEARKRWSHFSPTIARNVIVSEYLDAPYLYLGRKFHLRMYFNVVCPLRATSPHCEWFGGTPDERADLSLPRGKILTAAKPYKNADFQNSEIHDTHYATTPEALFFPMHHARITDPDGAPLTPPDIADIWSQLDEIGATSAELLADVKPYVESRTAYEIFAFDLLIIRDPARGSGPRLVVLEVNDRVGFTTQESPATTQWRADLVEFNFRTIDSLRESLAR